MSRLIFMKRTAVAILAAVTWQAVVAADVDPCTTFKWDVSGELPVMKQMPQAMKAAIKPGVNVPEVKLGTLYTLKLPDEAAVTFATRPAKSRGAETQQRDSFACGPLKAGTTGCQSRAATGSTSSTVPRS
jgi:hypothetical protein